MNSQEEMKEMAFGEIGRETEFNQQEVTVIEGDGTSIFDEIPLRKMTS